MLLKSIHISDFRGIVDLTLELSHLTVLIGENNVGKTSAVEALHICLSKSLANRGVPFSEFDFRLSDHLGRPELSPPIVLVLVFEEERENEWDINTDQVFASAIQFLADNRKMVTFRVSARFDVAIQDFVVETDFLDINGNPIPGARSSKLVFDLQKFSPVFLLGAQRDATQHFSSRSPFWAPFTRNHKMSEERRQELETQIYQINQLVLDGHQPFEMTKEWISRIAKLTPLAADDVVSIEAIPTSVADMLERTQLKLATESGAKLPISRHGAGTQSLAVLHLFGAYLVSQLSQVYDSSTSPILALEEPESHLHPSAIRSVWPTLEAFNGQKIVTTHSGDLMSSVPLLSIRRLARKNGTVKSFRVPETLFNPHDLQKITYAVRSSRGRLFFARCWLLVEGWSDYALLPALGEILGHDFELSSIACVEYAQVGLETLIKLADSLGIEWHVLADGDPAGNRCVRKASQLLGASTIVERITQLVERDIEHCLWSGGYHAVYEGAVSNGRKHLITYPKGTPEYMSQTIKCAIDSTSKPQLSYEVEKVIRLVGPPGVPVSLSGAISHAATLAAK